MRRATSPSFFLALILILLTGAVGSLTATQRPPTPVRRIDHIMIRTGDPGDVFAFFTDVLQLPIAWPMDTREGVTSGGAGFGNVNVEAIQFPDQTVVETKLVGLAWFRPDLPRDCAQPAATERYPSGANMPSRYLWN